MPAYHSAFLCGETVRIRSLDVLKEHMKGVWDRHHPIPSQALQLAGSERRIVAVHLYHMGDVLYELDEPSVLLWPEDCVDDYMRFRPEWRNYPLANEYYRIEAETIDGQPFVTIRDIHNVECLRVRRKANADWAQAMRDVASRRHLVGFEDRYGIEGTYDIRSETGFIGYWPGTPSWFLNATVISISRIDDDIAVELRRSDNCDAVIQFRGVSDMEAVQAVGLTVYDIAEYECDDNHRWFQFVNADPTSSAELRIAAEKVDALDV